MRDDTSNWPMAFSQGDALTGTGVEVRRATPLQQTLISSSGLTAVSDLTGVPRIGWPDIAPVTHFALTLRRDRVLLISEAACSAGWDAASKSAVTDVSQGFAVFDIRGSHGVALLNQLGDVSISQPSRSVVRLLLGVECVLYRYLQEDRFRLHVPRAQAPGFWGGIAARLT